MRRPDDSSLTPEQYAKVRAEAERVLERADAMGQFPTPVSEILTAAKVEEVYDDVLSESFLSEYRKKAGKALKRSLSKVLGLFDARARLVFIDRSLHVVKQTFLRLHEAGHGFMSWQRDLYAVVEDCEQTLAPDTAELFEREANAFASEVLFQLDTFTVEAEEEPFGILVPVKLSKKYGGSIYSTVRRYVSRNRRACTVLVLEPPEIIEGDGFRCDLRRVVASESFLQIFGHVSWPDRFTPSDQIGAMVPLGKRRMSGKRTIELKDRNGGRHECFAEAFTQKYQVFILISTSEALRPTVIGSAAVSS